MDAAITTRSSQGRRYHDLDTYAALYLCNSDFLLLIISSIRECTTLRISTIHDRISPRSIYNTSTFYDVHVYAFAVKIV